MFRKVMLALFAVLFLSNVSGLSIGTAPGVTDLGGLERGETYEVNMYIVTDSRENITIRPRSLRLSADFYRPKGTEPSYGFEPLEASQENITNWISFRKDTYDVSSSTQRVVELDTGGRAQVNGKITYFLEVPRSAEPGYHAIKIRPEPLLDVDGSGTALRTLTVYENTLVFNIPGDAERSLQIRDVSAVRVGDNRARLDFRVRNTGTVTTSLNRADVEIIDNGGRSLDNLVFGNELIAPGETTTVSKYWSTDEDLKAGNYQARGTANYITGNAFIDDTFDITSFIQIEQSDNNNTGGGIIPDSSVDGGQGLPIWLIMMLLVLVGAILYAFDIDPLLIILGIFALGVSLVIWLSSLPSILAALVLLITAGLFYYGWM